ncbi:MAG TPA: phosphodiester glycosidase family protein [Gaiellaceae bacterium]|nr:phosphodiester glycosidase family protein [Gaiellaceae bacterium]
MRTPTAAEATLARVVVLFRRIVIAAAVAATAALPAGAANRASVPQPPPQVLMPGVTYQRQVEFTPHGPVVLDVVTAPKPDGSLYSLQPVLSNGAVVATEKLTDMQKELSATATTVGVNGDFFTPDPGKPTGILLRDGLLDSAPASARSSLGIGADGTLSVAQVAFDGTWRGTGQRRQLDLNAPPVKGHTTLYTAAWGPTTPAESGVVVDVVDPLAPLTPNSVDTGVVTQVTDHGPVAIPPNGAVLVSRGNQAPHLAAEAPAGTTIEIRPTLTPNWSAMRSAIGGGPALVANGKPIFRSRESFGDPVLNRRSARSAVGQLADGRILLVTVEGGTSAYSAGMTNYELAVALARLGARTAFGLGTGPSAAMAFDGTLLTRPSSNAEQPLADALVLAYTGVYAAPPATAVVSPNGDGVDDTQTFTYKLVRPSQVTASLAGPGRAAAPIVLAQDAEQPGVHTLTWDAKGAAEGQWTFSVTGVDDLGRTTTAQRPFAVDLTLGSVAVAGTTVSFQLARPADVTVTVENANGITVATLLAKKLGAGAQQVTWNGSPRTGYRVQVTATNATGSVTQTVPFGSRRR